MEVNEYRLMKTNLCYHQLDLQWWKHFHEQGGENRILDSDVGGSSQIYKGKGHIIGGHNKNVKRRATRQLMKVMRMWGNLSLIQGKQF